MKKLYYLIFTCVVVVVSVLYYGINNKTKSGSGKIQAMASVDILKQQIDKKVERRKNGYAKPDKPDKFVEYRKTLTSGYGKDFYKANYKIEELKSAFFRKAYLKSTTVDLDWVQRGPGNIGGRTRALVVDPDDATGKTWYAGAVAGGVWKTEDAGDSWEIISPDLPNLSVVSLAMAPSNPNVIYAGTGEGFYNLDAVRGDGIFKSVDRGQTWEQLDYTKGKSGFYYVNSIAVSGSDENTLWAATNSGVVKSSDGGTSWEVANLELGKRYQKIIKHPADDNVLWVTCNGVGIYKTEDAGANWFLVNQMTGVGRIEIVVSNKNPDVLYAIDSNSQVYYSLDGGYEWAEAKEAGEATAFLGGQGWYNSVMAINPTDNNKGFIGGVDLYSYTLGEEVTEQGRRAYDVANGLSSLIEFSYMGGAHAGGGVKFWSGYNVTGEEVQIQFGSGKTQNAHALVQKATAGDFERNVEDDLGKLEFSGYVSVPFKVMNVTTGEQLHVSFVDDNKNGEFDLYEGGYELIIVHGSTYTNVAHAAISSNGGNYDIMTILYPVLVEGAVWDSANLQDGNIVLNSYELKDRSLTASKISQWNAVNTPSSIYSHADHHNITIIEKEGDVFDVIVGNDGGVGYSTNSGTSWTSKSNGYVTSQFYGVTRHPSKKIYFGGLQDNGSALSGENPNRLSEWDEVLGGDGFDVVWHTFNTDEIIGTYYYNQLQKSEDGGDSWKNIGALIGDNGDGDVAPFITKIAGCKADPDLLFVGGVSGLWKSKDFGDTWKKISMGSAWGFAGGAPKIAISEANPDVVWAGVTMNSDTRYTTGKVHVSTDGGESFTALDVITDMGAVSNIVTHPTDPNAAYLLFSYSGFPKVFRTTDLGQNWEDISGFGINGSAESDNGFPDVAVNTLLVMPFDTDEIWAGTEIGLFISKDNGASWAYADNGIPAVSIWDMKIVGDEVVVGTHGLGVWTVQMPELSNESRNPYITFAGINPTGDYVMSTELLAILDSVEIYNGNGLVKTVRTNLELGTRVDTVEKDMEISEKLYMVGYKSGQKYSSNVVSLEITEVNEAAENYINDFSDEERLDDFAGGDFAINMGYFGDNVIHSPHNYPENTDLIYTLKTPVIVSEDPDLAFMKYYDVAFLETGETNSSYPDEEFYDYAVVEATKDGLNWVPLAPGYDFSYTAKWADGGRTYESTPTLSDFVDHHINLHDTFEANDVILIRFRLHSDPFTVGWGWAIDKIRIQGKDSGIGDSPKLDVKTSVFPNPVTGNTLTLRVDDPYVGDFNVELYDYAGVQVLNREYFKGTENFEQQITLPQLPQGLYVMKVKMGDSQGVEKLQVR